MSDEQLFGERHDALISLVYCGWYLRERDNLIRHAVALGISKAEIARVVGISRQHVYEILKREEAA